MGVWGYAPWDNDAAADWYGDLFDQTSIEAIVEATLTKDPEEFAAEIRAAAALLIMLGRTYVWPIDRLDDHLHLAISQMDKVKTLYEDDPPLAAAVEQDIALLRARLPSDGSDTSIAPDGWNNFW